MNVTRRRFMLLAVALVSVNSFFWLAAGGFALPKAIIGQFFGSSLIRAEVLVQSQSGVQDWRIDRGVITAIAGATITLRETDGTSVPVQVDPNARMQGPARFFSVAKLRPRLRVVLYHQTNLPAELVQVEGAGGGFALPKAIIGQFFGNSMIRAEVLMQAPSGAQDWRIDRGVITAISGATITLREKDGTSVPVQVDPNARMQGPARFFSVAKLRPRVRVVLYHQANIPAELVQVEGVGG
jgi:hypothetical protein